MTLPTPRLRVLIVTKVFPNALEPLAAAFNRQQFAALARLADLELLAVVHWFPGAGVLPGADRTWAGKLARLPAYEWTDGLFVRHPRVLHLPRIDYQVAPALYVVSLWPLVRRWRGRFDVVLGSFAYPDGVAAVALARLLGVPSAVYALGSDLNVIPEIPGVPALLRWSLPRAARVIAVSRALAERAVGFGARPERTVVVPNGVDRAIFHPRDRAAARASLGEPADGKLLLFVGRLEPAKGVLELLDAFRQIAGEDPSLRLCLVGDGSLIGRARQEAAALPGRIVVAGGQPQGEVARWMAACDALVLPSWNEGTPNVVLEALASGRRVVATRVGGLPDMITDPAYGELCAPRDAGALAAALRRATSTPSDPAAIAAGATVSWDESAARLLEALDPLRVQSPR
jgi:glycosyltransferase involved in cell wall biosynthesis